MNNRKLIIFTIELLTFLVSIIIVNFFIKEFSKESAFFLIVCYLGTWFISYNNKNSLLEYYSNTIKICCFLILINTLYFILFLKFWMILKAFSVIIIWSIFSIIFKFLLSKYNIYKYKVLCHPQLKDYLSKDLLNINKAKFIFDDNPSEKTFKEIDIILVSTEFNYSKNWKKILLHSNILGKVIINFKEYEEIFFNRLSLNDLEKSWFENGINYSKIYFNCKSIVDRLIALMFLPSLLIFFIFISLIILITMGRPIFFTQKRVGRFGKEFKIYKFRSMIKNSEKDGKKFASINDMRVTKFGAFMRKFRIDELPQFFNILNGTMSLIGPRPEVKPFVDKFNKEIPLYNLRHLVKPGITGWAQTTQGYADNLETTKIKLQYDLFYVKHFGFFTDIKIVIKTIYTILTGFGSR